MLAMGKKGGDDVDDVASTVMPMMTERRRATEMLRIVFYNVPKYFITSKK